MKTRLLLVMCGLILSTTVAQAQLYSFNINLDGSQEATPNLSSGTGTGSAWLQWGTFDFSIDYSFSGLTGTSTASHIHTGTVGVSGPVIIPISTFPVGVTSGTVAFSTTITEAQALAMIAGNTYLNIHSSVVPSGEIRGQLVPSGAVPEPSTYALAGAVALLGAIGLRHRKIRIQAPATV